MSTFRVTLYNDVDDEEISPPFLFPVLPYPGLRILHAGGAWEVVRAQVLIADPNSISARNGAPVLVDVMVVESTGVHHP